MVACSVRVRTRVLRSSAMHLYRHRCTRRNPRSLRYSTISPVEPVKTGMGDQSERGSKRGRSRLIGDIPGLCDGNNSRHSVARMAGHRVVGRALHRCFRAEDGLASVVRKVGEGINRREFDRLVAEDNNGRKPQGREAALSAYRGNP